MADVFTLLTLPSTSGAFSAFTAHSQSTSSRDSSRSASPPRKIARLGAASDTHSTSSSSLVGTPESAGDKRRPIVLQVTGYPIKPTPGSLYDWEYALLRRTIKILLTYGDKPPLPATYDRITRACRVVVHEASKGEGLYDHLKMELERCVGALEHMLITDERDSVRWLIPFTNVCAWFEKQVGLLQSLLAYLDTQYVAERTPQLSGIRRLAHALFSKIIGSVRVNQAIVTGLADWLEWERKHKVQHELRPYISQLVRHMLEHDLYSDMIESTYLTLTHTFYIEESSELVEVGKMSAQEFLRHVQTRSKTERERAQEVLQQHSVASVQDTTDSALLTGRLQWLAKDALEKLIVARNDEQLKKMYKLFEKVGGLKVLNAAFKLHVQDAVKGIVTDMENDEEMVPRLLEFKAFCDKLVTKSFVEEVATTAPTASSQLQASSSRIPLPWPEPTVQVKVNREFYYGLNDAFRAGFKTRRKKPAELIAKHIDKAMRRGQKGKRDEDFQRELEEILSLYRFTDDMDVFRTFYQRALAKRLLLEKSASNDIEKAVLKKLQQHYDPEFGTGESMFKDLTLSKDLTRGFHERRPPTASAQTLSTMVLTRSAWPFAARKTDIDLPLWMQDDLNAFVKFYHERHKAHKLDWDHALGTATLKARFKTDEKELTVSLYQAVVLLLFNESPELSFVDIQTQTRLDDAELKRTLQSLACGKKRVLKKVPAGRDVNDMDVFHFNADFTDPRRQVHINSIQTKETVEEIERTQTLIDQDRKHALDAAIVRVMKGKKELTYEHLKTATIDAVKNHFVPDVSMIKQRITGLLEQEYLRRDENDMNKYYYVA